MLLQGKNILSAHTGGGCLNQHPLLKSRRSPKILWRDIYVRYHIEDEGWSDWIKGGILAGTVGLGKRMEAIQIKIQ